LNPTMSTLSPWAADAGQRLRELLAIGRSQGSLLVSDIHGVVDVDDLSPEVMAEVRVLLDREGILLVDDLAVATTLPAATDATVGGVTSQRSAATATGARSTAEPTAVVTAAPAEDAALTRPSWNERAGRNGDRDRDDGDEDHDGRDVLRARRALPRLDPALRASASSSIVGSRSSSCTIWRCTRWTLFIDSTMCTGMRIVRAWSAMARVIAWRIHHVA